MTTTTQPPEPIIFPIGIAGHNFVDSAGRPFRMWPSIECCWSKSRTHWPGVSKEIIQEIAASGGNWVHIRLGPHSNRQGAPDPDAAPGTGFLAEQADNCRFARNLGVGCELDVVDCWGIRTGNNFYNWPREIVRGAPRSEVEGWVRQAVTPFADLDNVTFQTGNECFAIENANWLGSTAEWEIGLRDMIRKWAPGKLVATNSHISRVEERFDYVNRHSETFIDGPIHNKPTIVNEYRTLTPERWEANAVRALEVGTIFGLWIGDMTPAQREDAYQRRARLAL